MLSEKIKSILKHEGVVTVVAQGEDFPHVVNTWNSFVLVYDNYLIVPVGGMTHMEAILKKNNRIIVVIGSKEVEGLHGEGAGFHINATANISYEGSEYKIIREKFAWARAIMKIDLIDFKQVA